MRMMRTFSPSDQQEVKQKNLATKSKNIAGATASRGKGVLFIGSIALVFMSSEPSLLVSHRNGGCISFSGWVLQGLGLARHRPDSKSGAAAVKFPFFSPSKKGYLFHFYLISNKILLLLT